ncbi:MAG: LTA synthase family protein [Lactovum sp.]
MEETQEHKWTNFIKNIKEKEKNTDEIDQNKLKKIKWLTFLTIVKLILMFLIAFIAIQQSSWNGLQFLVFVAEIIIIFLLSQFFFIHKTLSFIAYLLSSLLYILALSNMFSVAMTGDFVTYTIWTNILNFEALGSMTKFLYIKVIFLIILSFLPHRQDLFKKISWSSSLITVLIALGMLMSAFLSGVTGKTTLSGWLALYNSYEMDKKMLKDSKISNLEQERIYQTFEHQEVSNSFDGGMGKQNVIIIFTEGLSSEVLDYNNSLNYNLTSNLTAFRNESISFENYYNHTAATYRGIRGQLFSSQQYVDTTESGVEEMVRLLDTPLFSLPELLKMNGYETEMINPEPDHKLFQTYLEQLKFDKIITNYENLKTVSDVETQKILTDKDNYTLLLEEAMKKNTEGKSFFLSTYTCETHFDLDTAVTYGDGTNKILNKYYAMDQAFGTFWLQFKASPLYDNTIVVFTTDHASLTDTTYNASFQTERTVSLTPIPLMIYYPGQAAQVIDVGGRNSLGLTPTILDMLDYEHVKNYFLGNSLFSSTISEQEYITVLGSRFFSTKNYIQGISEITEDSTSSSVLNELKEYMKISLNQ